MNTNVILTQTIASLGISRYLDFGFYNQVVDKKVERVITSDEMKQVYIPLKDILDKTLEPNETYIDFTNQTFLYPLVQRQKPVYVNQSPGLLSGEYTQKEFIRECREMDKNVSFVLMPLEDEPFSKSLDGIENSYRYYLVSEYINNNFKPLFKNNKFAIWCKKDRYDEKYKLLDSLLNDNSELYTFNEDDFTKLSSMNSSLLIENDGVVVKSENEDPMVIGFENIINNNYKKDDDKLLKISINYKSNKGGTFELFYTDKLNENFTQEKVKQKDLLDEGRFIALIPYNEYSNIRFDIPEGSNVKIEKIEYTFVNKDNSDIELINYDYAPIDYHSYNLVEIPYIWANYDKIKLEDKKKQYDLNNLDQIYDFSSINKNNGNYLYINASTNSDGNLKVELGNKNGEAFIALTQFNCSLKQGQNQKYLIRVSSDFMWYSGKINSIKITSDNNAEIKEVSILEGDVIEK